MANGVSFSRLRAEFSRQNGMWTIRDGVVKGPLVGGTIKGTIDYPGNVVNMSGTFVPMYGLNNMFGQIPIVGLIIGGGSDEGLIGVNLCAGRHAGPAAAAGQSDFSDGAGRVPQDLRIQSAAGQPDRISAE